MKKFIKRLLGLAAAAAVALAGGAAFGAETEVPVVYFTKDISPAGLLKIYDKISADITGKVAVKLHTGEPNGPNLLPLPMAKALATSSRRTSTTQARARRQRDTARRSRPTASTSARSI